MVESERTWLLIPWISLTLLLMIISLLQGGSLWQLARHIIYALIDSVILSIPFLLLIRRRLVLIPIVIIIILIITSLILGGGFNIIIKPILWLLALIKNLIG